MTLFRSIATIGGLTMVSRVFGFLRDMLIAATLGAGLLTDAFFVAFKLPNFMRRIFAEGAFSAGFVPLFSRTFTGQGKEAALQFASEVFTAMTGILLVLTIIAEIFMPGLVWVMAHGFRHDPEKFALTVELTRITFPYLLCISLVSLLGGVLNSADKFAAAAAAPILMNLTMIAGLLALQPVTKTPAHALSIGVLLAGLAQLLWLWLWCRKHGMAPGFRWLKHTESLRRLLKLMAPAALGAGVAQLNIMVDLLIASHIETAVSYLYYADRINELPMGVIGVAVGTALLPGLSRHLEKQEEAEAIALQNRGIETVLFFALPAMVALVILPGALISGLFQYGAFNMAETLAVTPVLIAYALGLPAFVLIKSLVPGFFARHDTVTPVKIGILSMGVNIVGNLLLMGPLGAAGLALATSIAAWVNALGMGVILYRRKQWRPDARLRRHLPRILLASLVMGGVLMGLQMLSGELFTLPHLPRLFWLGGLVTAGLVSYFLCARLLGIFRLNDLKQLGKRKT